MDSDIDQVRKDGEIEIKQERSDNIEMYSNHISIERETIDDNELLNAKEHHNLWTSNATSCLISQYKKYRNKVGYSLEIRSLKDMFDKISADMRKKGFYFTPQKCENKWRVLERKYKNLVVRETLRRPGRIKHYGNWEHKRALDEIFNERRKSYLHENGYGLVDKSSKNTHILLNSKSQLNNHIQIIDENQKLTERCEESRNLHNVQLREDIATSNIIENKNEEISSEETFMSCFSSFLEEVQRQFETLEKNNQRRHKEMMAIRKSELEVQQRLLHLKEQKLDLERKKIIAIAQNI